MAYNGFFPQTYQYGGYSPYQAYQQPIQQPIQQSYQQQTQQSGQPQIQNGGFVSVRNIEEAFNWPVAPGNSITFKDENSPYIYTKTKGFSQLEAPIFERFRLVKEEDTREQDSNHAETTEKPDFGSEYKEQIDLLWGEVNALKKQLDGFKSKPKRAAKKEGEDEQIATDAE